MRRGESYEQVASTLLVDPSPSDSLPLVRRDLEALLDTTNRERHLTLIFSPSFLVGDGGALLSGQWAPIREELLSAVRDEWRALAFSIHFGDPLYWELRVVGDASMPETESSRRLMAESKRWPKATLTAIQAIPWSPHAGSVLERYPQMIELVTRYTRRGVDRGQAILNGYLPGKAGHNLLLATELYLAESQGAATSVGSPQRATPPQGTLAQRLNAPVTLVFARESLETAVAILSEAIGAPIAIAGRDLQLEGITRNQMLTLDLQDRPASEALIEVLRRANPDTEATGPNDARQKLVYVVRAVDSGDEQLVITTRSAAARRGETLPAPFTP